MILCVCKYGHSRSAAAVRLLHRRGMEAVAIGWHTSPETLKQLATLADTIIVMQGIYREYIPFQHRLKVIVMDVGSDIWRNPYDDELCAKLQPMIDNVIGKAQL